MADACLACGGGLAVVLDKVGDTRFGVPATLDIARCTACGLEQTLPRPSPNALGQLYARYYNFGGSTASAYTGLRQRFLQSRLYRLWLALDGDVSFHGRRGRGRLIDIGCNEGRGLSIYARNGFSAVEGLETNPVAASAARARGFAVHEAEVQDFRPAEPYDVAVLSNVLEHALDPAAMLAAVAGILKSGGEVWISCPNRRSWLRSLFGRAWINWHVPFHIVHFDADSLARTIAAAGLAPVERSQATPALWVAQSVISAAFSRPGEPTRALRSAPLVMALVAGARGLLFPLLWLGNRLGRGDCLIQVGRRT